MSRPVTYDEAKAAAEAAGVQVCWMIRSDMPKVLEIERLCFSNPWSEDDFIRCLRQRNCIGMAAHHGETDQVVCFAVYELEKTKLILDNFAVEPAWQRKGIGRAMMLKLLCKLGVQRRNRLSATIRESNLDTQLFFRSQGFRCTGVQRGFYDDTDEDGYQFEYRVKAAAECKGR